MLEESAIILEKAGFNESSLLLSIETSRLGATKKLLIHEYLPISQGTI